MKSKVLQRRTGPGWCYELRKTPEGVYEIWQIESNYERIDDMVACYDDEEKAKFCFQATVNERS